MMRRTLHLAALSMVAAVLAGAPARADDSPLDTRVMIENFVADQATVRDFHSVPLSAQARDRMRRFLTGWQARIEAQRDGFASLSRPAQIDLLLLRNRVRTSLRRLETEAAREAEIAGLVPFADDVVKLEEARRRMESVSARDAAGVLSSIADAAKALTDRVKKPAKEKDPKEKDAEENADALHPSKHQAFRAARAVDRLTRTLKTWFEYRDGYEPEFGWWNRAPHKAAKTALDEYAKHLRETVAGVKKEGGDLFGDPIGREALTAAIREESMPYGPDELLAIAEREMDWCRARAKELTEKLPGDDWKALLAHVKSLHAEPGEMDDLVARQSKEAIEFVESRELLTVPPLCKEAWYLDMISSKGQKTLPYAAYSGQRMHVAYATEDMSHSDKLMSMRGNNEHFSRIVTPHELIPGHHLQLFVADRANAQRQAFRTPFFVEGWALYWEMRLWDLDWPRGPEDRVGMLFWRKHRCARIVVTIKFHLGEMEPSEMVDYLVDVVGHEKSAAESEVRRYISGGYGPLYQCAYMIGGQQIRALHRELVESGRMTERTFHDRVLEQNSIPVEFVRAALSDAPLSLNHETKWRFYGDLGK